MLETSILGLGIVSIILALGSYLILRYKIPLSRAVTLHIIRDHVSTHCSWRCCSISLGTLFFITKLLLAESGGDMALALFSHVFAHHILSAVIAIVLIIRVAKGLFSSETAEPVASH